MHIPSSEEIVCYLSEEARARRVVLEDGDVFRQLRCSLLAGDTAEAGELQSRLSQNMREEMGRLYRNHTALGRAFDDLLPFDLWTDFQLGTFSRILGLKCEEVINT